MTSLPAPTRLQFADDMFLRRPRTGLVPVATQLVWVLPRVPEAPELTAFLDRLARGRLARVAARRRMPFARDVWRPLERAPQTADQVLAAAADVAPHERIAWLRDVGDRPLDPYGERPYLVELARLRDGGALLCLHTSHGVADGAAVLACFEGEPVRVPAPATGPAGLRDDLSDAVRQARETGRWIVAGRRRARRAAAARSDAGAPAAAQPSDPEAAETTSPEAAEPTSPTPPVDASAAAPGPDPANPRPAMAVAEFDSAELSQALRARGGSRGAFLSLLLARIAVSIGRVPPGAPVPVAVPVSGRTADDQRANATRIAMVRLPAEVVQGRDLAATRALSDAAYAGLADTPRELDPVPLAAVQALPDRVVRRLPTPPAAAVLGSNMGRLSPAVHAATGVPASAMVGMALHGGDASAELRASGGGVLGWLVDVAGTTSLTVVTADPDRTPDDAGLARLLRDEAAGWGVAVTTW